MSAKLLPILAASAACVAAPAPRLTPMPAAEPTPLEWVTVAARAAAADGVSVGSIVKLEEDWAYDDVCGVVKIALRQCDGTVTYRFRVDPERKWLWAFAPAYGYLPLYAGERAVFVWRVLPAYRYKECAEHQGMGGYCPADRLPSVTDALDVLPVTDSARVDSLFRVSHD